MQTTRNKTIKKTSKRNNRRVDMYEELITFIQTKGHLITPEVAIEVDQLCQSLEAENKSDITHILKWLEKKRADSPKVVEEIGINNLDKWKTHPETGNIGHESGQFFQIVGIKVTGAKDREVLSWTQPIIKQHECGILGILCKKFTGLMHYLLWAKFEPGSVINPQFSPTLQATYSNLQRFHGGKKPRYAEYFEEGGKGKIIVNVEQVEDPSRFYLKTNRCMIVELPENEEIEVPEDFLWLTLPQVKKLLKIDNVVNALARAVLGSI